MLTAAKLLSARTTVNGRTYEGVMLPRVGDGFLGSIHVGGGQSTKV